MEKPSVVIPYKTSRSQELIYTLRGLKNIPHGEVFIIGDDPDLQNVTHIRYYQSSDVAKNTHAILNIACNTPEITDDFIWIADDMYILEKLNKLPVLHRGTYDEVIASYGRKTNYYIYRMQQTNDYLKSLDIENPLCYELHVPFMINKKKWLEINPPVEYNKLSVYGNLANIGGIKSKDVKVRTKDWIPTGAFASSHESTFNRNQIGKIIKEKFTEKSIYEK